MAEQNNTVDKTEGSSQKSSKQERSPRALDSREAAQRIQSWENPTNLPDPEPRPGWQHRYIVTTVLGESHNKNVSKRFREGWEPCRLEDYPEFDNVIQDYNSDWSKKGNIEIGGQLLCKMPTELVEARNSHFKKMGADEVESAEQGYLEGSDPRMPTKQVFERKSRTTFGRDS